MIACRPETMSILPFALVCGCGGTSRNCTPAPATIRAGSFSRTGKPAAQKHEILIARDQWNLGSVWQGPRHLYRGGLTSACFPSVSALRREYGRGPFTQPSVGVILGGGFSSRSHCRPVAQRHGITAAKLQGIRVAGLQCDKWAATRRRVVNEKRILFGLTRQS